MAEEPEPEDEYFLSAIIEPLASMLVTILGWDHEKAVSTAKMVVYVLGAGVLAVTALKIYSFVK